MLIIPRIAYFVLPFLLCPIFTRDAQSFELSGKILSLDGSTIAHGDVWLHQNREGRKTTSDAGGSFRFDNVLFGPAEVTAFKDGYALGGLDIFVMDSDDVEIVLGKPDTVRVRVFGEGRRPLEGARVSSLLIGSRFTVAVDDLVAVGFPSLRSDDEGRIDITGLPEGSHLSLSVSHSRYARGHAFLLPVGSDVNVVLQAGKKVRGRVTNEQFEGVPKALVSVFRISREGDREFAEAVTDSEGFFTTVVIPGEYHVAIKHSDYASPPPRVLRVGERSKDNVFDAVLPNARYIEGSLEGEDGVPLPGVPVTYEVNDIVYEETRTRRDGTYALRVPPGTGLVRVYPPEGYITEGFAHRSVTIDVESRVRLSPTRLKPLPEIGGRVVSQDGTPLAGVLVASHNVVFQSLRRDPRQSTQARAITDEKGAFRIRLSRMPVESKVELRAEHPLRFLRGDIEVSLQDTKKPHEITLRPFSPNLEDAKRSRVYNDLGNMVDKPAPKLECDAWFNLAQGQQDLSLQDLRGKVVVLTFWGGFVVESGAGDILNEIEMVAQLYRHVDDVTVVSIHDSGKAPEDVKKYIDAFGLHVPVGHDRDPFLTFDIYNIATIPQTVLIDKQGILRHYDVTGRLLELIKDLRRKP